MAACRVLIAVVLVASLAGCGEDGGQTAAGTSSDPEFLTVMHAGGGSLSREGDGFVLTLDDLAPQVVAFTDRPERVSGAVSTSSYIEAWGKEYKGDPPNAALVVPNGRADADTIVFTLDQPELDGRSVRFQAEQVTAPPEPLGEFHSLADPSPSRRFDASSLFIDDGGLMQLVAYGSPDIDELDGAD